MKIEDIFNNDFFKQFKTGEDLNIEITFFQLTQLSRQCQKRIKIKMYKTKNTSKDAFTGILIIFTLNLYRLFRTSQFNLFYHHFLSCISYLEEINASFQ